MGGALAPVAAATSSHQGLPVGCLWFRHDLSWAWQGRKGDHVWEKRCSGLDLLGCDPSSGYAARGVKWRELKLAYRLLRLRDGFRATPSSSLIKFTLGLSHLGRTSAGRTGSGDPWPDSLGGWGTGWLPDLPPQLQITPLCRRWWPAGVPIPVPRPSGVVPSGISAARRPRRKSQGRVMPPSTCHNP